MENDKTLHDWINKTIIKKELDKFKQRPEYEELNKLSKATEGMQAPKFDKDAMLKEILASPKNEEQLAAKTKRLPIWLPLLAAASLVLFLAILFYPRNNVVELATFINEQQTKELPDGSKLTLYANSQLNYNTNNWDEARELHLTGFAKFEVAKGKPFKVLTDFGQVEVLGTTFTAKAQGNEFNVICTEGKVSVSNINRNLSDEITKNESIKIIKDAGMLVYLNGITKLKEVKLATALYELEDQYKIKIEVGNIALTEKVTCNFQHKNLKAALNTVLGPLNIVNKINDNVVILSR